jgi:hypothetical protein
MDTDTGAIHSSDIEEETPENEKVSKFTRLCFASGAIGEAVYGAVFNAFIIIFYNQAIGLSNTLIGVAIMQIAGVPSMGAGIHFCLWHPYH